MSKNSEHHDTYIIPPNFIEGSTLFGGMFKIRNVIEAGVLAAAVGVPVFSLDLSLTVRIIILSLVIVDIFNSVVYKNANIAIMGTSGAGKTFTLQLMALRMRRKGTQVFIIAPLKGHEFLRACRNTGGEFIQISPASKNCINVMEIRKTDRSVDELLDGAPIEKSELAAKIQQLHIFFSLLIPDITHEERQVYRLLTHCDEKELNSLFNVLPSSHPAKAPYAIFQQASDTVRSGVIIGLGSRLQVFQNQKNYKPTYLRTLNSQLSAIFNFAVKYYGLSSNPVQKSGTIGKKNSGLEQIWTADEFKFLLMPSVISCSPRSSLICFTGQECDPEKCWL